MINIIRAILIMMMLASCRGKVYKEQPFAWFESHKTRSNNDGDYAQLQEMPAELDSIRSKYADVLAFTDRDGERYYYVTNDTIPWAKRLAFVMPDLDIKVGIANGAYQLILPIEYDKIYNPNQIVLGAMAIEKEGKYGLFFPGTGKLIEPEFDKIFPSTTEGVMAFVQNNGQLGRMLPNGEVLYDVEIDELMSDAINWGIVPADSSYTCLQLADLYYEFYAGVLFAPEYLRSWGVVTENISNISPGDDRATEHLEGTVHLSVSVEQTESVWDELWAAIVKLEHAVVYSRAHVLTKHYLVTLDEKANVVDSLLLDTGDLRDYDCCKEFVEVSIVKSEGGPVFIDSVAYHAMVQTYYMDIDLDAKYYQSPNYRYCGIDTQGCLHTLEAPRNWDCTKFVKMDSSYFDGCYSVLMEETDIWGNNRIITDHLDQEDLDLMLNEIYAEHGYIFTSEKWDAYFRQKPWYKPLYNNIDDRLSDIEKHNIDLISRKQKELKKDGRRLLNSRKVVWESFI